MEKYVLEALVLMGDTQAALDRMVKRYAEIIASPLTTLPEEWRGGTGNHAWSGGPLTILSQYVAGIAPLTPAYETYEIRPRMGSLKQVKATVDSAMGRIEVDLNHDSASFTLSLVSPPGTSAQVCLPAEHNSARVLVNGKRFWDRGRTIGGVTGVAFKGITDGRMRFTAGPGRWVFRAEGVP
jgi:hypothetical protein